MQTNPRFEDLFYIREGVWLYDSASAAAFNLHLESLSNLRVSGDPEW
jgi:hypothetical protein